MRKECLLTMLQWLIDAPDVNNIWTSLSSPRNAAAHTWSVVVIVSCRFAGSMAVCNAESSLASVDEEEGRVVLFLLLFLLLLYRFMLPLKNLTEWDGTLS